MALESLNPEEVKAAAIELCELGLLTCTHGKPGDDDATYALAWLPLDQPECYSQTVRDRHAENLRRFGNE